MSRLTWHVKIGSDVDVSGPVPFEVGEFALVLCKIYETMYHHVIAYDHPFKLYFGYVLGEN